MQDTTWDPDATPFYDLMSAGLIWTDEKPNGLLPEGHFCLRWLFRYRTSLIEGSADDRCAEAWGLAR